MFQTRLFPIYISSDSYQSICGGSSLAPNLFSQTAKNKGQTSATSKSGNVSAFLTNYDQAIIERLNTDNDVPWVTVKKALAEIDQKLNEKADDSDNLKKIQSFIKRIRA